VVFIAYATSLATVFRRQPADHYNGRAVTPHSVVHDDFDARSR
jgi:hypothetical protein